MDINFELYKIFYHAAASGSFSEAAKRLYITQSAVSQAIAGLEDKTGCKLFIRKSRSIKLTSEGEVLLRHIEQAYNFIKAGEDKLQEIKNLEFGEIRIGVSDTVCRYFMLPALQKFTEAYPNVKIRVINRTSPQIVEILKNGNVDLGIVTLPVTPDNNEAQVASMQAQGASLQASAASMQAPAASMQAPPISPLIPAKEDKSLRILKYTEARDIFVASQKFEQLKHRQVPLNELVKYPLLLLHKDSETRRNLDRFLKAINIEASPEIELESIDLLVEFARIGLGIAHVLRESASAHIGSGSLFEVKTDVDMPARPIGIATLKNIPLSHTARKFLDMLGLNPD